MLNKFYSTFLLFFSLQKSIPITSKKQSKKLVESGGAATAVAEDDYALGIILFCASSKPDLSRRGIVC